MSTTVDRFQDIDCRNEISEPASQLRVSNSAQLARNVHLAGAMRGVIRSSDVLRNPLVVWREFGVRCLLRCLSAIVRGHSTTFLELAHGGKD